MLNTIKQLMKMIKIHIFWWGVYIYMWDNKRAWWTHGMEGRKFPTGGWYMEQIKYRLISTFKNIMWVTHDIMHEHLPAMLYYVIYDKTHKETQEYIHDICTLCKFWFFEKFFNIFHFLVDFMYFTLFLGFVNFLFIYLAWCKAIEKFWVASPKRFLVNNPMFTT